MLEKLSGISQDIKHLTNNSIRKLKESFFELAKKLRLLGEFKLNNKNFKNDYEANNIFDCILQKEMISKSIQESNKQFFVKNSKAKMLLQKLNQTEKQIQMLYTKRNIQLADLFSMIK